MKKVLEKLNRLKTIQWSVEKKAKGRPEKMVESEEIQQLSYRKGDIIGRYEVLAGLRVGRRKEDVKD